MDTKSKESISSSSSSSFTNDLFGSKGSSSTASSTGKFESIFAPSSKVIARESARSNTMIEKKQDFLNEGWNAKPDNLSERKEGESEGTAHKSIDSLFTEERVPCHFSSSIYYGGQDIYSNPQTTQSAELHSSSGIKKDGGEEDIDSASRGNWWQGSFYY